MGMEMTTKQKTGAAVALLAVAALGVDKLLLGGGGPATASAQAVLPEAGTLTAPQIISVKQQQTFAQELERFAVQNQIDPLTDVPDAFGEEEVWIVTSVMGKGDRGAVRIGDSLVRVGQSYQDAQLVRVDRDGAVFLRGGREFRAVLKRPEVERITHSDAR